jgi:hypothetical protein
MVRITTLDETFEPQMRNVTLTYLKFHWGSAYKISYRMAYWYARRRDNQRVISAVSAEALLDAIRADYLRERVPRG